MSKKVKYCIIPVLYLSGIYVISLLVVLLSSDKTANFSPCSALYILNNYVQIGSGPFELVYSLSWVSQFVASSIITLFIINAINSTETDWKIIVFAFLVSIIFVIATFIAYEYIVAPLNNVIYGFKAGLMGPIGFFEDLLASAIICIPLFFVIGRAGIIKNKNIKNLIITSVVVFIVLFILNSLTTDLWFPPLVNYGSAT